MIKRLLSLAVLAACTVLAPATISAQNIPESKMDAWSKANPGNPLTIDSTITDLGNGLILLDFTVSGIGYWQCTEICTGNEEVVLVDWTRSTGKPVRYVFLLDASSWTSCFFNKLNTHWLPPIY